jgi:hypothetical protein
MSKISNNINKLILYINIYLKNEYPLIYYLIMENHLEMLEKLLKLEYREQII